MKSLLLSVGPRWDEKKGLRLEKAMWRKGGMS